MVYTGEVKSWKLKKGMLLLCINVNEGKVYTKGLIYKMRSDCELYDNYGGESYCKYVNYSEFVLASKAMEILYDL